MVLALNNRVGKALQVNASSNSSMGSAFRGAQSDVLGAVTGNPGMSRESLERSDPRPAVPLPLSRRMTKGSPLPSGSGCSVWKHCESCEQSVTVQDAITGNSPGPKVAQENPGSTRRLKRHRVLLLGPQTGPYPVQPRPRGRQSCQVGEVIDAVPRTLRRSSVPYDPLRRCAQLHASDQQ